MTNDLGLAPWESDIARPGFTFGRLKVLSTGKTPGTYRYFAICQCACGSSAVKIRIDKLRSGRTTSCGCAQREASTKHGLWNHPLYTIWRGMMQRCYNPRDSHYRYYGVRGILVCERWHDVRSFVADLGPTYREGLSLDRIDNDAGYFPDNCRWVPLQAQASNKRSNIMVTYNGETMCLAGWSEVFGIRYQLLWERIVKYGWSAQRALTTPPIDAVTRCAKARASRKRAMNQ